MISRVIRTIGPVVLTIVIAITLAACGAESVEVPGETVVVEKVVIKEVQVPGETVVVEKVVTEIVEVPGETVTVEVVKEVQVPGETVVVEKEVVRTVEVPGETVTVEVVKEVQVPGDTIVVEKEVVKTVEVPGETVVVEVVKASSAAPAPQQVSISAGEVDDNQRWAEYMKYREEYDGPPIHDLDVSERYIITVIDAEGHPVPNAIVRASTGGTNLFEGRTYANGQTIFFPRISPQHEDAQQFVLHVEKDDASESTQFVRNGDSDWTFTLDSTVDFPPTVPLDLLFLLDATGSMADEIDQIKSTLLSISSRISDLPSEPDLRFGMVAYRDRGDDFITRTYHFEPDVQKFLDSIREVRADGGGDGPESVNEALHVAISEPQWRSSAIRLVFLIADAPPHLDYEQDYDYAEEMVEANRRGIKVFPIASSGLDAQGEYIFRQIAVHTMGRFLFILYGGSTPHKVGQYSVENLDDLVVKLVEEELDHLSR